jgi:hypothetical protein
VAAQDGCLYSGPTTITLYNSGSTEMMNVTSPNTPVSSTGQSLNDSSTNGNVCVGSGILAPTGSNGNGVIFVQNTPSSQTCHTNANPFNPAGGANSQLGYYDGQTATPDCEGDAFVAGTVAGALTVAAQNDVIVTNNIQYTTADCGGSFNSTYTGQCSYNTSNSTPNDALGLIAYHFVEVDRPVTVSRGSTSVEPKCGSNGAPAAPLCDPSGGSGLTIDAAILALNDSFAVNNYTTSGTEGTLDIYGTVAQDWRGAVGTFSGNSISTGYSKYYVWDSRLEYVNVPYYLNPGTPQWAIASSAVLQGVNCVGTALPGYWTANGPVGSPGTCSVP